VAVFVLDRVTKAIVSTSVLPGSDIPFVDHVIFIQNVTNSGAAFGIRPIGSLGFLLISAVVAIALAVYEVRHPTGPLRGHFLLGLIMGGTVGNGYDRLLHGSVTDFIALHFWPVFNVADSAISVGVALLLASQLVRLEGHDRRRGEA
jgi:signal peptidase II